MISVNAKLTLYAVLPLPLLFVAIYFVQNLINQKSEEIQAQLSTLSNTIQESFSGIRVIKSFVREAEIQKGFHKDAETYKEKSMALVNVQAVFFPTVLALVGISTILTVYIGGQEVINGSITAGNIAEFIVYVNMLTWPVTSVGWVTSLVQRAAASQKRINEFIETEPEITNPTTGEFNFDGRIEFKNVTFTFPNTGIKAIENLSFKINKGDTLAIVGKTGSGKSTIFNLLMRQYDCDSGEILVNGIDIKKINLDSFREQSGVVPQDVFLFSDTIANNLKFGLKNFKVELDILIEATKRTHVYHNIIDFPDKFETLLGERGVNLSGGQKQRVSIARALIRNPKFLLLDDCLSAVDTETEEIILRNLNQDSKNRTSIIVSHRISTIRNANHILVLDKGAIVESGTHQSLMELNKEYAEMYQKQLTEN
jgi:ATP-binding cassette subfamily B protein